MFLNILTANLITTLLVVFSGVNPILNTTIISSKQSVKSHIVTNSPSQNSSRASKTEKLLKLPILMYHHIDTLENINASDKIGIDLRVGPNIFEQELQYLKQQNYTSITSQDFGNYLDGKFVLPQKPILITFDDGYKDNFTNAFPLLQKYGFKGDFAIITGVVGTSEYMSWDDLETMTKAGMGISSHTVNHCYLSPTFPKPKSTKNTNNISPVKDQDVSLCPEFNSSKLLNTGQIYQEISQSKATLESKLNVKITQLIYPYGHYNDQVVQLTTKAGYKFATTVQAEYNQTIDLNQLFATSRIRQHGQQSGKLVGFFQ